MSRTAINYIQSKLDLGDYWYWADDEELDPELTIWQIIHPLRYDVLIRKSFVDFYKTNRDLYSNDFDSFILLAKKHVYYDWFTNVLVVRYLSRHIGNEKMLAKQFEKRIIATANLYDSVSNHGFDIRTPIILYTGKTILPTESGRQTGAKYYMGDGCHRLACLMSLGYRSIPKQYVKVKCFKRLVPLDNTRMLQSSIPIDQEWT
jgi:hypothetical protein